jgi:hypothetical protein
MLVSLHVRMEFSQQTELLTCTFSDSACPAQWTLMRSNSLHIVMFLIIYFDVQVI